MPPPATMGRCVVETRNVPFPKKKTTNPLTFSGLRGWSSDLASSGDRLPCRYVGPCPSGCAGPYTYAQRGRHPYGPFLI